MANFAKRPQPYRLQWPLTPAQVENMDQMFEILFKRISQTQLTAATAASTATTAISAAAAGLITAGEVASESALIAVPGPQGPQGPAGVSLHALFEDAGMLEPPDLVATPYAAPAISNIAFVSNVSGGTLNVAHQTVVAVTFNTDAYDPNGLHDTASNTSRITAALAGRYILTGGFKWSAQAGSNTGGIVLAAFGKNGTVIDGSRNYYPPIGKFSTDGQGQNAAIMVTLARGDYVELLAYQDQTGAGATLTIDLDQSAMHAVWVSP
jgi:hypothetical protein